MKKSVCMLSLLSFFTFVFAQQSETPPPTRERKAYTIEQATSQRAQLHTMAFSGLAFLTGNFGADTFFPPGKVADFFGFQYMRDNDQNQLGHNTDFLTRIANNVLAILTLEQLDQLKKLANEQAPLYDQFAQKRIVLIRAFRQSLEQNRALDRSGVIKYTASLYQIDAELSYGRAVVCGRIIASFTDAQREQLAKLDFKNSATWPLLPETLDKRSLSHRAHVGVMTYASELFSWYAGSVMSDTYFCPERHATYFGGFYLKDFPAMGNRGYSISTSLTGDGGRQFIDALTPEQAACLSKTTTSHAALMKQIVSMREQVAGELRKAIQNQLPDQSKVNTLVARYGELDGEISFEDHACFASIYRSLTPQQTEKLRQIRNLDISPEGIYLYSDKAPMPEALNVDFLFQK